MFADAAVGTRPGTTADLSNPCPDLAAYAAGMTNLVATATWNDAIATSNGRRGSSSATGDDPDGWIDPSRED